MVRRSLIEIAELAINMNIALWCDFRSFAGLSRSL